MTQLDAGASTGTFPQAALNSTGGVAVWSGNNEGRVSRVGPGGEWADFEVLADLDNPTRVAIAESGAIVVAAHTPLVQASLFDPVSGTWTTTDLGTACEGKSIAADIDDAGNALVAWTTDSNLGCANRGSYAAAWQQLDQTWSPSERIGESGFGLLLPPAIRAVTESGNHTVTIWPPFGAPLGYRFTACDATRSEPPLDFPSAGSDGRILADPQGRLALSYTNNGAYVALFE